MPRRCALLASTGLLLTLAGVARAQAATDSDPTAELVRRLDLERYKATIKGLTQFGDRRQGTDRNRSAVDWIEAQLKSYGCANVERVRYDFQPPPPRPAANATPARPGTVPPAQGGARFRGVRGKTGVNTDSLAQPDTARHRPEGLHRRADHPLGP